MIKKFELFISFHYLRSKQKSGFVSFISLVSIIGITLGVATLIIVMSVMNGFQNEIRQKIIGVSAHMQLFDASGKLMNWQKLIYQIKNNSNIEGFAPYIDGQALVSFDNNVSGVLVRGISDKYEKDVSNTYKQVESGTFASLIPNKFNVIIGKDLARNLGVGLNEKITLITPDGQNTPVGIIPRMKRFTVTGIFNTHMAEYDGMLIFINIEDAKILFKMGDAISGIRLKVNDLMHTPRIKEELGKVLPDNILSSDWIDQHQNYFSAVELEKKMMFIILTLIIAVAAFNLVSTLIMLINDKRSDIAILRTMGASKKQIMTIFMLQGGISGIIGTIIGTILGVLIAYNVGAIVNTIENLLGTKLINSDVYLIDYLPSKIIFSDVCFVVCVSILLSILATIYPSRKAANLDPVEALRYE